MIDQRTLITVVYDPGLLPQFEFLLFVLERSCDQSDKERRWTLEPACEFWMQLRAYKEWMICELTELHDGLIRRFS